MSGLNDFGAGSDTGAQPVFREPWEATAFALVVQLHQGGCFDWVEWSETLATEIAGSGGVEDVDPDYYQCWLRALERLVEAKGLASTAELRVRRDAWEQAARETAHGEPIVLPP